MTGDTNAVTVVEMAHRRQLVNAGVLRTDSLLLPERPLPQGPEFGDVHIDDLVLFSILHFSRLNELAHCVRATHARNMYGQLSMPTAESERAADFRPAFWGGSLEGIAGTLGFHMCRRTSLMYVTLTGAVLGVTRTTSQQLLGAWNLALIFRREALRCLDVAFLAAQTLPTRRPIPASCALLDDLLLVLHRAAAASRSEGYTTSGVIRHRRQPILSQSVCGSSFRKPMAERSTNLRKNRESMCDSGGLLSASTGTHSVAVRMCCARHSLRLVCALRVPVPRARTHQRARAHRSDVAREASGDPWREGKESCVASTAASSSEQSQKAAHPQGGSTLASDDWHSSVLVRPCQSTCCGCHLGSTLLTHLREEPRSPTGHVRCRHGPLELQLFCSGQPLWPVSSNCSASLCPRQLCNHWALAISHRIPP